MTGWLRNLIRRGNPLRRMEPIRQMEPIRLADQLEGLDGQWVAIKDGEVVGAKHSVDALRLHLHDRDIIGASMMRVPSEEEPELVGLG